MQCFKAGIFLLVLAGIASGFVIPEGTIISNRVMEITSSTCDVNSMEVGEHYTLVDDRPISETECTGDIYYKKLDDFDLLHTISAWSDEKLSDNDMLKIIEMWVETT